MRWRIVVRRLAGAFACLGLVSVLSGCSEKLEALPSVVTVDESGWFTVQFPVCQGTSMSAFDTLVYVSGDPHNAVQTDDPMFGVGRPGHPDDLVYTASVNPTTLRSGLMIPNLPVTDVVSGDSSDGLSPDRALVVVDVGLRRSFVEPSSFDGPGTWLVIDDGYHGNPRNVVRVTEASGLQEIKSFCADLRAKEGSET